MKRNIGVLITDHNVREVLDICDYSYVMHAGEIIAEGNNDKILGNKEARKFYLGDSFKFSGGASRTRTDHLVTASDALSQMSYSPSFILPYLH